MIRDFLVRYFERDYNEKQKAMQILNSIRPKEGWKFNIRPSNSGHRFGKSHWDTMLTFPNLSAGETNESARLLVPYCESICDEILEDENFWQDDFRLIVNHIIDEILLQLIKAGSNGLSSAIIVSQCKFPALSISSPLTRLNFHLRMMPIILGEDLLDELAKTILCHLHKQSIVFRTRRSPNDCKYRIKDFSKSKSPQPRRIIPRTKNSKTDAT